MIDNEMKEAIKEAVREVLDERDRIRTAAHATATAQLTEAQSWPGFTDNQPAILAAFILDKRLTVREAYEQVVR